MLFVYRVGLWRIHCRPRTPVEPANYATMQIHTRNLIKVHYNDQRMRAIENKAARLAMLSTPTRCLGVAAVAHARVPLGCYSRPTLRCARGACRDRRYEKPGFPLAAVDSTLPDYHHLATDLLWTAIDDTNVHA